MVQDHQTARHTTAADQTDVTYAACDEPAPRSQLPAIHVEPGMTGIRLPGRTGVIDPLVLLPRDGPEPVGGATGPELRLRREATAVENQAVPVGWSDAAHPRVPRLR